MSDLTDPFEDAKRKGPILVAKFQGEEIPMILRLNDIRKATKDTKTYSSDAPRRVPIPSEEEVRTVRQYPLEVDPPAHADYRKIVEPFFLRPKLPEFQAKLDSLVDRLIGEALKREVFDVVHDFAIPLQSYALTYLLNVDEKEAELWINWGIHVFKDGDGKSKGPFMETYCEEMFAKAEADPGDDFFSALNSAAFEGRKLTLEEKLGFANIAFAGGRDTIIHTVVNIVDYFAANPKALDCIRENPKVIKTAAEEFFRVFIPLTHIGRVCPYDTDVHGRAVKAGGRVSLCWSSANRDPEVFKDPNVVKLDRRPNPHVAFGFGPHACLGAHHSRAVVRTLIGTLADRLSRIEVMDTKELVEIESSYSRKVGYELFRARFIARD